jgi:hypothetical protein
MIIVDATIVTGAAVFAAPACSRNWPQSWPGPIGSGESTMLCD